MGYDPRYFRPRQRVQSDIESQQCEAGIPYYPALNASIFQKTPGAMYASAVAAMAAQAANPAGDIASYTRFTFDSRPPMAVDFLGPLNDGSQTSIQLFSGATTIPQGYVGIVRAFSFVTSPAFFVISQGGSLTTSARITLLRNGSPIPGFTNINVSQWGPATVTIPCFIMLNANDVISGSWNGGQVVYEYGNGFSFYGNLLLDDGRNLPLQSGNLRPEPVVEVSANAVGDIAPVAGTAPAYSAGSSPDSRAPVFSYQTLNYTAPFYPGPWPPAISVINYGILLDQHHKNVRSDYLQFVKAHPGALINVTGNSSDAMAPYPGIG